MKKIAVLIAAAAIAASLEPSVASACASATDISALRAHWATVRSQPVKSTDNEGACRAYAASFYESVTTRLAAAMCLRDASQQRTLALLDSDINAFNDLLAAKCGS